MKKITTSHTATNPRQGRHGTATIEKSSTQMPLKKKAFGQHFLRKDSTVFNMISRATITKETSVLEIGCGDGFLTKAILANTPCKKLLVYEIDPEWADIVRNSVKDPRLDIQLKNILDVDLAPLKTEGPWVVLANLPYNITFPILSMLEACRDMFTEIIVMVQEEVAQKIAGQYGRSLSPVSFFYQHRFTVELLEKIEPGAFSPPPKVFSRLIYFKPILNPITIPNEAGFWKFLKLSFTSPRQTLRNNLRTTHFDLNRLSPELLALRSQQLNFATFLEIWEKLST